MNIMDTRGNMEPIYNIFKDIRDHTHIRTYYSYIQTSLLK